MEIIPLKICTKTNNGLIEIYPVLIKNCGRNYLVDCGYESSHLALHKALKNYGLEPENLTGIIVTHDDIDHLGGLALLKKFKKKLLVLCGKKEELSISGRISSERLLQAKSMLDSTPKEHRNFALNFIKDLENTERFNVDIALSQNDVIEKEIVVIETPGHTKGHISLFYIPERILIAGDALVIENDEFNIANPEFTLDIPGALQSIEKIKELKPQKIICYHGGVLDVDIDDKLQRLLDSYDIN